MVENGLLVLQIVHFLWFITLLASTDATVHARAQCKKGSSSHNNSFVAMLLYSQSRSQHFLSGMAIKNIQIIIA